MNSSTIIQALKTKIQKTYRRLNQRSGGRSDTLQLAFQSYSDNKSSRAAARDDFTMPFFNSHRRRS